MLTSSPGDSRLSLTTPESISHWAVGRQAGSCPSAGARSDASVVISCLWVVISAFDFLRAIKSSEHRVAWLVAIAADALQILALPLFAAGGLSPADSLLDLVVAAILIRLLGWHWAFLPTLLAELTPGFDLFPTWTAAVFYVTRHQIRASEPEILPPGPTPERRD